jgi:hypothetical protein
MNVKQKGAILMTESQKQAFENDYMPYIIKWGKITCWVSIPLIMIPTIVLIVFYKASINFGSFITALIPLISSMLAWYIVDPISLFPILHVPGLYMTYIAGNSKEIRAPAAIAAMSAANVDAGTEHGTVISCLAIATSVFVSVACMTLVAVGGNVILSILPKAIITALNYLLPALYGSMCMQRALMNLKTFSALVPITIFCVFLKQMGVFGYLPMGGGYAQILILVICGSFIARALYKKES